VGLEQLEAHVEVPAGPRRPRQLAQRATGATHALALGLLGEERQGRAQAASGHAHLVYGVLVTRQPFRQLLENSADTLSEEG
jgi:hypothetical protein